jgi:hypothetical protein
MSRLAGTAMGTKTLTAGETDAAAASIRRLHRAAPPSVLGAAEPMPFGPVKAGTPGRFRTLGDEMSAIAAPPNT